MDRHERSNEGDLSGKPSAAKLRLVADELEGHLSCAWCGYELQGLSIRDMCPECGAAVKATILARVDPKAHDLAPLSFRGATAVGMVTWSVGGLVAVAAGWWIRLAEASSALMSVTIPSRRAWLIGVVGLCASCISSTVMVRPTSGIPRAHVARAMLGVFAYIPLIWCYIQLVRSDAPAYFSTGIDAERIVMRVFMSIMVVAVLLGLRPNAVRLAHRSLVMRDGRVDRQSMLAVSATVGVWTVGDVILLFVDRLNGLAQDLAYAAGYGLIALGSILFLLGAWGIAVDTVRLFPVLARRSRTIADVFEGRANG